MPFLLPFSYNCFEIYVITICLTNVPFTAAGDWGEAVPAPVPAAVPPPQVGVPPAQTFPATGWE